MGCMHSFVWGEVYPDFMDALMPLACLPVQIAGRNRIARKLQMDAIRNDPDWKGGDYATEPQQALRTVLSLGLVSGTPPLLLQKNFPRVTRLTNTWTIPSSRVSESSMQTISCTG